MKKSIENYIRSATTQELIDIYHTINGWRCPKCFQFELPITYLLLGTNENALRADGKGKKRRHFDKYLRPIKKLCEEIVTHKEILRHHNLVRLKSMNNEEFEQWYPISFPDKVVHNN